MLGFPAQRNLPTVLLIDDDLISREVMATILTMSGYSVHTAVGGQESIDLLAAGECLPEVVLMDVQMPGLNGTHLVSQLRARTRATLYGISGSKVPDDLIAVFDGFLQKPFSPDDLQKLLKQHEARIAALSNAEDDPGAVVVDASTLAKLREIMPEAAVRQIYDCVVTDLVRRLAALDVAVANADADAVRAIGHAIKGGCGMAGALQAARLGALLEAGILEPTPYRPGSMNSIAPGPNGNHLDNKSTVLRDLRAAVRNLERMLETEFAA
jgi:two-component system cell cycle response regulator DivK